ncbi:MerR family transcriptional regulator [Bacillus sp. MRMR6]|uniref:MerR family transcriptional regulator n=1 Tax=Bacillus sp. MRMR6 TaxID=1928617 RepID=UPI000AAEDBE7|nr:MerR family transcriptional regulator [Bacillus sp. MRMR6]
MMHTLNLKEVSKIINVNKSLIRQWEKDFEEMLVIPRTKQGARIYTESEISFLLVVKELYGKKLSKELIREQLKKKLKPEVSTEVVEQNFQEVTKDINEPSVPIASEEMTPVVSEKTALQNADLFFDAMDTYKETFLNEVKSEIRSVLRKEVVEEVRKEISKGTFYTVKSLSDSIYKSSANTKAELEELSEHLDKTSERTTESLRYLSNSISTASIETSEEIFTLSKQLSESTEQLANYVDSTNAEIYSLTEALERDREDFVKEREEYRHDIRQREAAFQNMLVSFRDVAAAKEKKWWKFWE